jgi:hypothetical protein
LQAAENRLKEFKLKYLGSGQRRTGLFRAAVELNSGIETAKLELEAAEQSRDAYRKELQGETATFLPDVTPAQTYAARRRSMDVSAPSGNPWTVCFSNTPRSIRTLSRRSV